MSRPREIPAQARRCILPALTIFVEALMRLIGMAAPLAIGAIAAGAYMLMTSGPPRRDVEPPEPRDEAPQVSAQSPEPTHASSQDDPHLDRRDAGNGPHDDDMERASAIDERTAAVTRRMADNLYARAGGGFVALFAKRGLAPSDAKAVIRSFFDQIAKCVFDAARAEAEAQSTDLDAFLADLESSLERDKTNAYRALPPLAGLDMNAVEVRAAPCVLSASQEAGIPFR